MPVKHALLAIVGIGAAGLLIARRARAGVNAAPVNIIPLDFGAGVAPDQTYNGAAQDTGSGGFDWQAPIDTGWQSVANFFGGGSASTVTGGGGAVDMSKFTAALAGPGAPYRAALSAAEAQNGIPGMYLTRMAYVESAFNPNARSGAGAVGLMQFLPATAAQYGADPANPYQSIAAAGRYLAALYAMFSDWDLAVGAYNAGPGNMRKAISGNYTLRPETIRYVANVTGGDVVASVDSYTNV